MIPIYHDHLKLDDEELDFNNQNGSLRLNPIDGTKEDVFNDVVGQ